MLWWLRQQVEGSVTTFWIRNLRSKKLSMLWRIFKSHLTGSIAADGGQAREKWLLSSKQCGSKEWIASNSVATSIFCASNTKIASGTYWDGISERFQVSFEGSYENIFCCFVFLLRGFTASKLHRRKYVGIAFFILCLIQAISLEKDFGRDLWYVWVWKTAIPDRCSMWPRLNNTYSLS